MSKGSWREFDDFSAKALSNHERSSSFKNVRKVLVQRTRGGKGGKTVTIITGLELEASEAKSLLKIMKVRCGSGGTIKKDCLELQGDQVEVVMELLQREGYRPKQVGG